MTTLTPAQRGAATRKHNLLLQKSFIQQRAKRTLNNIPKCSDETKVIFRSLHFINEGDSFISVEFKDILDELVLIGEHEMSLKEKKWEKAFGIELLKVLRMGSWDECTLQDKGVYGVRTHFRTIYHPISYTNFRTGLEKIAAQE